jgi:hypothetical protein
MKSVLLPSLVAVTLVAAPLGCTAPASAAPAGPAAVDATIKDLRALTTVLSKTVYVDLNC